MNTELPVDPVDPKFAPGAQAPSAWQKKACGLKAPRGGTSLVVRRWVFVAFALTAGCTRPVNPREVPGKYEMRNPPPGFSQDTLELDPGGRVTRTMVLSDGSRIVATQDWRYDGKRTVLLTGEITREDYFDGGSRTRTEKGELSLEIRKVEEGLVLETDGEYGLRWFKR